MSRWSDWLNNQLHDCTWQALMYVVVDVTLLFIFPSLASCEINLVIHNMKGWVAVAMMELELRLWSRLILVCTIQHTLCLLFYFSTGHFFSFVYTIIVRLFFVKAKSNKNTQNLKFHKNLNKIKPNKIIKTSKPKKFFNSILFVCFCAVPVCVPFMLC